MKICVLVKEVPDAAVEKRMDSNSKRLDRSGEKNLNPFDTHAIEAAMQIREGGAVDVDEIVAVTMGPESAFRALHKAVSLGADRSVHLTDDALSRLGRLRHRLRAGQGARVRVARPGPAGPAVGRRRVLHDRRRRGRPPEDAVADAGHQDRRRGRQAALRAPGRVRLRHRRGRAARRDLGRRRHQRAALPVAQGDHGREEEAARHEGRPATSASRPTASASRARAPRSSPSTRRSRRPPARSSRTRTPTRRSRRSSPGSTKGSCSHERPHLRTPLRGRVQQELARRRLRGRQAGQGDRRRGRRGRRRGRRPHRRPLCLARQVRRDEGLPRQGARGPRPAGRRRDGQGHPGRRLQVRAVRRRPARLRDRRGADRAARRRRDDGGHGGQGPGRQARRRAADPPGLGDRGRRLRRRARASSSAA